MIAKKTFCVKIGGISYQVPAGKQIPGAVLDYWQAVKSKMIAEHEQQPEVKKAKYKKPEAPNLPETEDRKEQEDEKE